jgi:cytochrome c oxidase cbb3-type subunit 3
MSLGKKDPHTGIHTTGHEWAGITELNTPIPLAVKLCYGLTFAIALLLWVLLPTWPLITTYTPGLLGFSQRDAVQGQLDSAKGQRAPWADRVAALDLGAIDGDPDAKAIAIRTGKALWINSQNDETRFAQMPAFGRDQILEGGDIGPLVAYLRHLSGLEEAEAETVEQGAALFAENCASCHGEAAKGDITLGAPNLTDGVWIYGGDRRTLYKTLYDGRQGHMPHWSERLSPVQLKVLALYVHSLSQP